MLGLFFLQDRSLALIRVTSLILLYSIFFLALNSLHVTCLETGIGIFILYYLITINVIGAGRALIPKNADNGV